MERDRRRIRPEEEAAERPPDTPAPGNDILALQQSAGNAAVAKLLRAPKATGKELKAAKVNHERVSVPPSGTPGLKITPDPADAGGTLSYAVDADGAAIDGATKADAQGNVAIGAKQGGGKAKAVVKQSIGDTEGGTIENEQWAQLNFVEDPTGITSTAEAAASDDKRYRGEFTHTFKPGPAGAAGLERARVNERFSGALIQDPAKSEHAIASPFGAFKLAVNPPDDVSKGWDLDSSGTMVKHDEVTIDKSLVDARPFVANASQPSAKGLPQSFEVTQGFHSLHFPDNTFSTAAVASTPHVRTLREKGGKLEVVLSSGGKEVVEDYAGPAVFRKAKADKATVEASTKDVTNTVSITAEAFGADPTAHYRLEGEALGCKVDASGTLTVGTKPGTVKVRVGDKKFANYDEVTITIAAPKAAAAKPTAAGDEGTAAWAEPPSE